MSGLMKWPGSRSRRKAPREWLKHVPDAELETLMGLTDLSKLGPLPPDAQWLYQETQARAETNMERAKTTLALPPPDRVTHPADESFADWLKFKWQSADASLRHTLRTVAEALGISVPMSRTRTPRVGGKDSSGSQRSDSEQHPNPPEPRSTEIPAEEESDHYDGPQWSDDDALNWEPCSDLREALHPEDRGWN